MSSGRKGRSCPGKVKKGALGRALVRNKKKKGTSHRARVRGRGKNHTADDESSGLKSVYETTTLQGFLGHAQLSGRTFVAKRQSAVIVDDDGFIGTEDRLQVEEAAGPMRVSGLQIPRRPAWNKQMTPEELDEIERESFLEWRRKIAVATAEAAKKNLTVTPFEKNLQVWRQLWRVLERSDIVLQIVDVRNIDLYRCEDLETYAQSLSAHKRYVLLLNKSDFMSEPLRKRWAETLRKRGVDFIFFSAKREQQKLDDAADAVRALTVAKENFITKSKKVEEAAGTGATTEEGTDDAGSDAVDGLAADAVTPEAVAPTKEEVAAAEAAAAAEAVAAAEAARDAQFEAQPRLNTEAVLTRTGLFNLLRMLHTEMATTHQRSKSVIGTVGFPNVGKSSLINVLMEVTATSHTSKRVAVGATPGKTKHFQTLELSEDLTLCDCPGLVFPVFMRGKADMVVNGVLPIDQMREFLAPVALVCRRIPRSAFRMAYALETPARPDAPHYTTARQLLQCYSFQKGFLRGQGSGADIARSARYILKDYASGKLLFCFPPPSSRADASLAAASSATLRTSLPCPPSRATTTVYFGRELPSDSAAVHELCGESNGGSEPPLPPFLTEMMTAEGEQTLMSTAEAAIGEEESAFDLDLEIELGMLEMRTEEDRKKNGGQGLGTAQQRRIDGKKGKGKGKGRRGRHGRDMKPYEQDGLQSLGDFSFVQGQKKAAKAGKGKQRRRKKGEKQTNKTGSGYGVTMKRAI